jgi:hypothetical protein
MLAKKINIIKYAMDTITSHNDFSRKLFTLNVQQCTLMGFISSFLGLTLVWKWYLYLCYWQINSMEVLDLKYWLIYNVLIDSKSKHLKNVYLNSLTNDLN